MSKEAPDPNWYTDTGAIARMTNDPGKIVSCSFYKGKDKIYASDGAGLSISHAGIHHLQRFNYKKF